MPRPTPLTPLHVDAGARIVEFAGWDMPIQYDGIQAEHRRVREAAGIFDVSHMGRLYVRGAGAEAFLDGLLPAAIGRLRDGRMAYSMLCNDAGGVIDDLAVTRLGAAEYLLVVNASRADVDRAWIDARLRAFVDAGKGDVQIDDATEAQAMIALQGPQAETLLTPLAGAEIGELGFFRARRFDVGGVPWLVSRSGYTGEDGFEVICPAGAVQDLWHRLREAGAAPAGLAARDTLRIEAGLCLYGHELTEETTPIEAGLSWALALDKERDFPGRQVLRRQAADGAARRLVGLRLESRGIPRAEQEVRRGDEPVGVVTSGTHSPVLGEGVAMAYVDARIDTDSTVDIAVRQRALPARIVDLPFIPARVKRRRKRSARR